MTVKKDTHAPHEPGSPGIGKRAAKRRMKLEELERRQSEALARMNQERAALRQAVAEEEARARRQERAQQKKDEGRVKSILGELVLTVMRDGGPDALQMSSQHLLRLSPKDRQLLDKVWAVISARADAEQPSRRTKGHRTGTSRLGSDVCSEAAGAPGEETS